MFNQPPPFKKDLYGNAVKKDDNKDKLNETAIGGVGWERFIFKISRFPSALGLCFGMAFAGENSQDSKCYKNISTIKERRRRRGWDKRDRRIDRNMMLRRNSFRGGSITVEVVMGYRILMRNRCGVGKGVECWDWIHKIGGVGGKVGGGLGKVMTLRV